MCSFILVFVVTCLVGHGLRTWANAAEAAKLIRDKREENEPLK